MLPTNHDSIPTVGGSAPVLSRDFGRYQILECLGQGAMGAVYKARDTQLDRIVALKIPKFSAQAEPGLLERFYREARSAATLSHPNICPVYDVGEHAGTHYISMGYIEGRPLSAFIKPDRPQPARKAAMVVRKLAQALEEAHRQGIVHRDLKPDNVMIDRRGQPIIMDFGLAQKAQGAGDIRATQGGQILGTPAYMPPEQVDGDIEHIGPASDVYSLGVIFYELLTSRLPYEGSVAKVLAQIIRGQPQPPSQKQPGLDSGAEAICLKMMAADRTERYQSMSEVLKALTDWLKGESPEASNQTVSATKTEAPDDELAALFSAVDADAQPISSPQVSHQSRRTTAPRSQPEKASSQPVFRQRWFLWSLAGAAGLLLLLGVLFIVRVGDQTVKIEIDDPNAQVFVDGDHVTIKNLGATIDLRPGEHNLEVRRGDVIVQTDKFQVLKGKNPILKISIAKAEEVGDLAKGAVETPIPIAEPDSKPGSQDGATDLDREVAEWILKSGGSLGYSYPDPGKGGHYVSSIDRLPDEDFFVYDVRIPKDSRITLSDTERISQLSRLIALEAPGCRLTDQHLRPLAKHPKMFSLNLSDNPITDAGVAHLKGLKALKHLRLNGTQISAAGVRALHDLPNLTDLELGNTQINDESIQSVVEMSRISTLGLAGAKITDKTVSQLKTMPNLWGLSLERTQITDEAIAILGGHPNLHKLELAGTKITDSGLSHLSKLPQLTWLNIANCPVTNAGIMKHIAGLDGLDALYLAGTPLTDEGLEALSRLPKLRILHIDNTKVTREGMRKYQESQEERRRKHRARASKEMNPDDAFCGSG